ncbi:MAG: YfhO family protein [Chitinophagaceae bacterium]|nr:YfhO family protein [Chitinophagaceae bacterium]
MKNFQFKKLLPHLAAAIIFLVVASIYCKPAYQGMVVNQHDMQGWLGMAQQSYEFKDQHGYAPLWTNSMFGGMPAYQIFVDARTNIQAGYLQDVFTLGLPKPVSFFFLACLSFYFLCIVFGANPFLGILGALSYAYSTFDPIIVSVGHDTQMLSLGFAPAVLAGLILMFRRHFWTGFTVTTLAAFLLLLQNHIQVIYYTFIIAFILFVAFLFKSIREKQIQVAIKSAALALIAGVIAFAGNAVTMLPTMNYAKESMRGGRSELTIGDTTVKTKGGLDKDYAFRYSLGLGETFTFMVPGLYGGSNGQEEFRGVTKFTDEFSTLGVPEEQALQYENAYAYWGNQPVTSGPVYLGAIVCLLFIFGAVYLKGWLKWWLVISSAFGLILAYGANLSSINYFLFDHMPLYNKFRAPTMALIIPQICFPLLGVLALTRMVHHIKEEELLKKLKLTGIIAGVLIAMMGAFYFTASFTGPNDKALRDNFEQSFLRQTPPGQEPSPQLQQQAAQISTSLIAALQSDRKSHMGGDLIRTMILMALGWGILYFLAQEKIKQKTAFVGLIVLTGFDLIGIGLRYLNHNNFVEESEYKAVFTPTPADLQIKQDPDHANFRVFNQTVDPFNDATTSYHHNSVGGYHPAKLALYNDLITHQLGKGNMEVFNMLNTRYFIMPDPRTGQPYAQPNPGAFGNVWFVKGIKEVPDANGEMLALDDTDLKDTAVVETKYANQIQEFSWDSAATIQLVRNINDTIDYSYKSTSPQVAVFSEIYYPEGWSAYVDGQKTDYFRTDYVLRGMYLPAGEHNIQFRFEPESYKQGRMITIISSIIIYLLLLISIGLGLFKKQKPVPAIALKDLE